MTIGTPRTFHKKFKFVVEIDNIGFAGFQKCSELEAEIAKIEYSEGGTLIPNKDAGRISVSDVTLERGATADGDMWNWFKQVGNMVANSGLGNAAFKRTMDIVQNDRDGTELRRWSCTGAWPNKFVAGDWDNEADENVIEKVTIVIDTFDKIFGT